MSDLLSEAVDHVPKTLLPNVGTKLHLRLSYNESYNQNAKCVDQPSNFARQF